MARLDVGKVLFGAFLLPWRDRREFFRRLFLPLVGMVALALLWSNYPSEWPREIGWAVGILYWTIFSIFAVAVHRLVLVPTMERRSESLPRFTGRQLRFLVWLLGVGALAALFSALVIFLPLTILANLDWPFVWLTELARLPGLYLLGRVCLVFPAIALDRQVDLRWSWNRTRGNGARLFLLVGLLPWVISELGALLFREDAGFIESLVTTIVISALYVAEIATVSLCYRELVPPPASSPT
jgi:hypothetical protein